jgi:hypothetical protein
VNKKVRAKMAAKGPAPSPREKGERITRLDPQALWPSKTVTRLGEIARDRKGGFTLAQTGEIKKLSKRGEKDFSAHGMPEEIRVREAQIFQFAPGDEAPARLPSGISQNSRYLRLSPRRGTYIAIGDRFFYLPHSGTFVELNRDGLEFIRPDNSDYRLGADGFLCRVASVWDQYIAGTYPGIKRPEKQGTAQLGVINPDEPRADGDVVSKMQKYRALLTPEELTEFDAYLEPATVESRPLPGARRVNVGYSAACSGTEPDDDWLLLDHEADSALDPAETPPGDWLGLRWKAA